MIARLLQPSLAPLAGLAVLSVAAAFAPALLLINESPSLPKGLYARMPWTSPHLGAVVAIEPPPKGRAYLTTLGMPASTKLLKRIAATGGGRVCTSDSVVRLPGRRFAVQAQDRRGVGLPQWRECRALEPEELFVLGDAANSFDSRYFGPIRRSAVAGVYREVLTW